MSFLKEVMKTDGAEQDSKEALMLKTKGAVSETCWTTDHKTLCHMGVLGLLKDTKRTQMSRANSIIRRRL